MSSGIPKVAPAPAPRRHKSGNDAPTAACWTDTRQGRARGPSGTSDTPCESVAGGGDGAFAAAAALMLIPGHACADKMNCRS